MPEKVSVSFGGLFCYTSHYDMYRTRCKRFQPGGEGNITLVLEVIKSCRVASWFCHGVSVTWWSYFCFKRTEIGTCAIPCAVTFPNGCMLLVVQSLLNGCM